MAVYFVFEREYVKDTESVLEFIQRYVFKINPTVGNKGKTAKKRRIFTLIEKIYQQQQNLNSQQKQH